MHFLSSVESQQHTGRQPCRLAYTTPSAVVKNVAGHDVTGSEARYLDFPCLSSTCLLLPVLSTSFPSVAANFLSCDDQYFKGRKLKSIKSIRSHYISSLPHSSL